MASLCRDTGKLVLADGEQTTLHSVRYRRDRHEPGVAVLNPPEPLAGWCAKRGVEEAMIGGFFIRASGIPLGETWRQGRPSSFVPFDSPWDEIRTCAHLGADGIRFDRRSAFPDAPDGDLLQAGPLLVAGGCNLVGGVRDPEGFSSGSEQFDSDITVGRYPRAALGLTESEYVAAVCDGRAEHDAGLTLPEMADAMIELGCETALNLDGGGSASLVSAGRLVNSPREEHGIPLEGGRPISTALVFAAAAPGAHR